MGLWNGREEVIVANAELISELVRAHYAGTSDGLAIC